MTEQEAINVLEKYADIPKSETVRAAYQMAIAALRRQIPKKVKISLKGTTGWNTKCHCPNCRTFISNGKYCSECGQALEGSYGK